MKLSRGLTYGDRTLFAWEEEDGTYGVVTIDSDEMSCTCTKYDNSHICAHVQQAIWTDMPEQATGVTQ